MGSVATISLLTTTMLRRSSGRAAAQAFMAMITFSAVTEPRLVITRGGDERLSRFMGECS